jgi:hypothetical protein
LSRGKAPNHLFRLLGAALYKVEQNKITKKTNQASYLKWPVAEGTRVRTGVHVKGASKSVVRDTIRYFYMTEMEVPPIAKLQIITKKLIS